MSAPAAAGAGRATPPPEEPRIDTAAATMATLFDSSLKITGTDSSSKGILKVVHPVHADDIHGVIKISAKHFVSGSKDGKLKVWSAEEATLGDLVGVALDSHKTDYRYWITALAATPDGSWFHGTRDGLISYHPLPLPSPFKSFYYAGKDGHICKERNTHRVTCITSYTRGEAKLMFTGHPGHFVLWEQETGKCVNSFKADKNDWIYCINVISDTTLAVVVGSCLDLWTTTAEKPFSWKKSSRIINETDVPHDPDTRPHIASANALPGISSTLALASFDGRVRICDTVAKKVTHDYREHKGRAWCAEPLSPHTVASGADDGLVKIWDLRAKSSALTLPDHAGRVSALVLVNEHCLLAGSCPDNLIKTTDRARFTFYDTRMLLSKAPEKV